MIPMELKFSISYKLFVVCVSTVERETGQCQNSVSKHELVLPEALTQFCSPCILYFVEMTINE